MTEQFVKVINMPDRIARICGQCHVLLSKENTGELGGLQPDCNDCTNKDKEQQCSEK